MDKVGKIVHKTSKIVRSTSLTKVQKCRLRRSTQLNCINCNKCKCEYNNKPCDNCGKQSFYCGKRPDN